MHIPPLFKKRNWQILILGLSFGGIIAYMITMYMYGVMYENLLEENIHLKEEIVELNKRNENLLRDQESLDEKHIELMRIETIEIEIKNEENMGFDRLAILQLKQSIKREVDHIIGKNIESVSENDQLLISSVENKAFKIDDFFYYFRVYQLTIAKQVKISLEAKLSQN